MADHVIKKINDYLAQGDVVSARKIFNAASHALHPLLRSQKLAELSSPGLVQGVIYIDITDYILFFRHRSVVSGIQRVVHSIIKYIPKSTEFEESIICWCMTHPVSGLFSLIDKAHLDELVVSVETADGSTIASIADEIITSGCWTENLPFYDKDVLLIPGGPWATPVQLSLYAKHKRSNNLFVLFVCYDIIPIQFPEFCSQGLVDVFEVTYDQAIYIADAYISISRYTSEQIKGYELSLGRKRHPSRYLDWRLGDYDNYFSTGASACPACLGPISSLLDSGFVLVVSTIEPRKNHYNLLRAWRLVGEQVPSSTTLPTLVLAGKIGWNSSDFMQQVQALNRSGLKVIVLENLDDSSLAWLYSNCLFVVMPSYVEGWGLSITESLMRGKACIASNSSSMVEASQGLCPLFDPHNTRELASLIFDYVIHGVPPELNSKISSYAPISWEDSVMSFASKAFALISKGPDSTSGLLKVDKLINIGVSQNAFVPKCSRDQRIFSSYSCWYPIEGEQGFARSFGSHAYVVLDFACLPESFSLVVDLLPGVEHIFAKLEVLGSNYLCNSETANRTENECRLLFQVSGGDILQPCLVRVDIFANRSVNVLHEIDPRLSAFSLKRIEFSWGVLSSTL